MKYCVSIYLLLLCLSCRPGSEASSISGMTSDKTQYPPGYYMDDALPDRIAYLTFDDGPTDWTREILDTLKKSNIKATFFICAHWMPKSPGHDNSFKKYKPVLERMIYEGHTIGNHTASHINLTKLSSAEIADQLDLNQTLLNQELGTIAPTMTLIRTPYGAPWYSMSNSSNRRRVADIVRTRGLVMMWSRHFNSGDSAEWVKGDWYEEGKKTNINEAEFKEKMKRIYNNLIQNANGRGMVVLFHDTHLTTAKILPEIIQKLISQGYSFSTMEEYVEWRWNTSSREFIRKNLALPDEVRMPIFEIRDVPNN